MEERRGGECSVKLKAINAHKPCQMLDVYASPGGWHAPRPDLSIGKANVDL